MSTNKDPKNISFPTLLSSERSLDELLFLGKFFFSQEENIRLKKESEYKEIYQEFDEEVPEKRDSESIDFTSANPESPFFPLIDSKNKYTLKDPHDRELLDEENIIKFSKLPELDTIKNVSHLFDTTSITSTLVNKALSPVNTYNKNSSFERQRVHKSKNQKTRREFNKDFNPYDINYTWDFLLKLPTSKKDILYRQSAIKELLSNKILFDKVHELCHGYFQNAHNRISSIRDFNSINHTFTVKRAQQFLSDLKEIGQLGISQPFQQLREWTTNYDGDFLLQTLASKSRTIKESILYFGLNGTKQPTPLFLKEGLNPEDVFEEVPKELREFVTITRKGKKEYRSYFVNFNKQKGLMFREFGSFLLVKEGKNKLREVDLSQVYDLPGLENTLSPQGRFEEYFSGVNYQLNTIRKIAAHNIALPFFLSFVQLRHLYNGARLDKMMNQYGLRTTFPHIDDTPHVFSGQKLYNPRLVLEHFSELKVRPEKRKLPIHDLKKEIQPNSYDFQDGELLGLAEGRNISGKSEFWAAMHTGSQLAAAGYSLPASKDITIGITSQSHFLSVARKEELFGGSELDNMWKSLSEKLQKVNPGDRVIIDEFGDRTNEAVAKKLYERIVQPLLDEGCQVLLTCHHGGISELVEQHGGKVFVPHPNPQSELKKYEMVIKKNPVDYEAEKTLDKIGIGTTTIKDILHKRITPERNSTPNYLMGEEHEDLPF